MLPKCGRTIVLLCLLGIGGCASWKEHKKKTELLSPPAVALDSIGLEVTFVHVPPDTEHLLESLWREIDEQHLPADLRRRFQANGFRCGMVGSRFPAALDELIAHTENKDQVDTEHGAPRVEKTTGKKRIQCRSGKRSKIVTSPTFPKMAVMINEDGALRGQSCEDAHCEFSMRTFTLGDGRVRVELTPEVHYGLPKQTIVGDENAFRFDVTQDRIVVDQLHMETTLSPGETLLLTATREANGLGGQFFQGVNKNTHAKILLIRLAQSHMNDLFVPDEIAPPIATPTE